MRVLLTALTLLALAVPAVAQTNVIITVVDKKSGEPFTDLRATDFSIAVGQAPRAVQACEYKQETIDIVLLLDSSLVGEQISRLAPSLIRQLDEHEQMSIVAYDNSAQVIQEFTASQPILMDALQRIEFGNSPRLTDALYATAADGFEGATYRRVILLLTSGVDGPSSVKLEEVIRICRRNQVSVFPVHLLKFGRSRLMKIARLTGGAPFSATEITKRAGDPATTIFRAMRGHYELTVAGNLPLGDDAKITIASHPKKKVFVSYMEME